MTPGWIAVIAAGLAAWTGLAVAVGVLIGRTVRNRNRQIPDDDDQ